MTDMITTIAGLEALFDKPSPASLEKETARLTPAYRRMLEASPFCTVATSGPDGLDCSPRGDGPGFVRALSETQLAIPDRRGNNRLDTLRNIIHDARIALLFLIPGVNETLRINGRATLSTDPELTASFAVQGAVPKLVIVVDIERVYFQCARALVRSALWDPSRHADRAALPTAGQMVRDAQPTFDATAYDATLPERQKTTLY